jgi:hypothetical protein
MLEIWPIEWPAFNIAGDIMNRFKCIRGSGRNCRRLGFWAQHLKYAIKPPDPHRWPEIRIPVAEYRREKFPTLQLDLEF